MCVYSWLLIICFFFWIGLFVSNKIVSRDCRLIWSGFFLWTIDKAREAWKGSENWHNLKDITRRDSDNIGGILEYEI
jgi:hypothetical protein